MACLWGVLDDIHSAQVGGVEMCENIGSMKKHGGMPKLSNRSLSMRFCKFL